MKRRKRIGLVIAHIDDIFQCKFIPGVLERAFELDYDCVIFSYSIKDDGGVVEPRIINGASNIYNIINFDNIDALIIAPDSIANKDVLNNVIELIKKSFNGPVVSVDILLPDFVSINTDDTLLIEKMCDHLIEVHGFRTIDFMNGKKGHQHSIRRLEGYKKSLKKHGIKYDENRVYDGDFWYNMGDSVVDDILSSDRSLPQAIMCANDPMSISIVKALKKRGIKVPEQIAVTGFDSTLETINFSPTITSAKLPSKQTGINTVEYIHSVLENKPYHALEFDPEIIIAQSCGCGIDAFADYRSQKFAYTDSNYRSPFRSISNFMMSDLISVENMNELATKIVVYTYQIKPYHTFFLCLCDDWMGCESEINKQNDYRRLGYHQNMRSIINFSYLHQISYNQNPVFDKSIMLPDIDEERDKPAAYYFNPLHFDDRCFGYTVLKLDDASIPSPDYREWLHYVCNSFECLRRQQHIQNMYKEIEKAALTDGLTGLYNRNAFNLHIDNLMQSVKDKTAYVLFIMADLNFLKTINDRYGHLAGDEALRTIGKAIKNSCSCDEKCYRFGGDEFIIIGQKKYTQKMIDDISDQINEYLEKYNQTSGNQFEVKVSLGATCKQICTDTKIDDIISEVDAIMYENKRKSRE